MERDLAAVGQFDVVQNFNSHAHVERDVLHGFSFQIPHISTHTLTWSVTRGARRVVPPAKHFNSHAHVERDLLETFMKMYVDDISTHTLTWSVTDAFYKAIDEGRFQLTRSRGA